MQTRYLKTLMMVIEEGSFARAAELMHVTQSAVSQRIKILEDHLGHQLLIRSSTGLEVTPAGQIVIAKGREMLGKEREMIDALNYLGSKRRISLCCTPTFGMAFLSQVLNEFIRRHAEIADLKFIFLQPAEALHELRNDMFDLAVIEHAFDLDFNGLEQHKLLDDELVFIVAPDKRPTTEDKCLSLAEIRDFRLFARRDGCSSKEVLRHILLKQGGDLSSFESVFISDDLRYTIQAVAEGQGIAFLSKSLVGRQVAAGELVAFSLCGAQQLRGRSALLRPGRVQDPLIRDLLECVMQVFTPCEKP